MPNPNAAPQTPGKVKIDLTPGAERVEIDGYRLEQHLTAIRLTYDAKKRTPILLIELHPSSIDVTASRVEIQGEFRDFLIHHGWRAPELSLHWT